MFSRDKVSPSGLPRPDSAWSSAFSVTARSSGCTACSTGIVSDSTCSSSMPARVRSCSITSPEASDLVEGSSGSSSDTYRSPNNVLGSSRADTFDGNSAAWSGSSASRSSAPSPVDVTRTTRPTTMPRTFTSDSGSSWLPVDGAFSTTSTLDAKAF